MRLVGCGKGWEKVQGLDGRNDSIGRTRRGKSGGTEKESNRCWCEKHKCGYLKFITKLVSQIGIKNKSKDSQ